MADLREALAHDPPVSTCALCQRLGGIDRATLMRWVRRLDGEIARLGQARRSAYALRRPVRGRLAPLPLYRLDAAGAGEVFGHLSLIAPDGSALEWAHACPWPLEFVGGRRISEVHGPGRTRGRADCGDREVFRRGA